MTAINRRSFLKGALAASAIAVLPSPVVAALAPRQQTDRERLQALIHAGRPIVGHEFVLEDGLPVLIDAPVFISGCIFRWVGKAPRLMLQIDTDNAAFARSQLASIADCIFDYGDAP